jgi:alkylation response protein AidB-like acyl-CoA dehydrogenase
VIVALLAPRNRYGRNVCRAACPTRGLGAPQSSPATDAKLDTIFEGTSEIQRLVIGRALRTDANTEPLDQRMETPR